MATAEVAEFQGLYGPYTVSEILLQKIWMRGLFQLAEIRTVDGRALRVEYPGEWNRLGGPDFKGARFFLGDRLVAGDVEVHFRVEDWRRHRHDADPAYQGVALHVVLFPPEKGTDPARTVSGEELPCFVLLDCLYHDLEEYAADEAISTAGNLEQERGKLLENLLALSIEERRERLLVQAWKRWEQKVFFARRRLEMMDWDEACHHTALECLGYRYNRGPMLAVAARFSLEYLASERPVPETLVGSVPDTWTRDGLRPANHPVTRLRQYVRWAKKRPDWPERLGEEVMTWPRPTENPRRPATFIELASRFRRDYQLPERHRRLDEYVAAGTVPGTRFITLVCDGFLPLVAARNGEGLFAYWFYWYPGDAPDAVREILKTAGITDGRTVSHANGWVQGILFSLLPMVSPHLEDDD